MATQFDPIAKDESLNTTESPSRNVADVLAEELQNIAQAIGGGGGGSVQWTQIQTTGTKIAEIEINGVSQDVYAPSGGGSAGTGAGWANSNIYREEITSITADMWAHIADGSFTGLHVGMHYTAPSGRTYWFADADYFFDGGYPEQTNHHFLVIEDKINHTAAHHTTNTTAGGAASSDIYTTTLPTYQSELETDFGAAHILSQGILMCNASNNMPSGWAWVTKNAFIPNMPMVFGHYLQYIGNTSEMYNGGNRVRQLSLFRAMPETIIGRRSDTDARDLWWTDDVASSDYFGLVSAEGNAGNDGASNARGIRRAFIIG